MWRRQEEPKASPSPRSVVVTPPAGAAPPQSTPQYSQPYVQPVAQHVAPAPPEPKAPLSIVSKGISINGQVTGTEDLQIDGEVKGTVQLPAGRVMIGPEGRMSGNIQAREIVVRGTLKGNLRASERILVGKTGRWEGDSTSPRLAIEEGAMVHGKIEVAEEKKAVAASGPKAAPEKAVEAPKASNGSTGATGSTGANGSNGSSKVAGTGSASEAELIVPAAAGQNGHQH